MKKILLLGCMLLFSTQGFGVPDFYIVPIPAPEKKVQTLTPGNKGSLRSYDTPMLDDGEFYHVFDLVKYLIDLMKKQKEDGCYVFEKKETTYNKVCFIEGRVVSYCQVFIHDDIQSSECHFWE